MCYSLRQKGLWLSRPKSPSHAPLIDKWLPTHTTPLKKKAEEGERRREREEGERVRERRKGETSWRQLRHGMAQHGQV